MGIDFFLPTPPLLKRTGITKRYVYYEAARSSIHKKVSFKRLITWLMCTEMLSTERSLKKKQSLCGEGLKYYVHCFSTWIIIICEGFPCHFWQPPGTSGGVWRHFTSLCPAPYITIREQRNLRGGWVGRLFSAAPSWQTQCEH